MAPKIILDPVNEETREGNTVLKSIIDIVIARKKACHRKIM
jgi:hypothetical protein